MNTEFRRAYRRIREEYSNSDWKPLTLRKRAEVIDMWEAFGDYAAELQSKGWEALAGIPMYNAAGIGITLDRGGFHTPAYIFRSVDFPVTYAGSAVYTDYRLPDRELRDLNKEAARKCRLAESGFIAELKVRKELLGYFPPLSPEYAYYVEIEIKGSDYISALSCANLRKVTYLLRRAVEGVRRYIRRKARSVGYHASFETPEITIDEFWYVDEIYAWKDCIIHEDSGGDCSSLKVYTIEKGNLLISTEGIYGTHLLFALSDTDDVIRFYDAVDCYKAPGELAAEFVEGSRLMIRELVDRNDALINYVVANVYGLGNYEEMSEEEYDEIIRRGLRQEQLRRERELRKWLKEISEI